MVNNAFAWARFVDNSVKIFDGKEENLQTFINQVSMIKRIFPDSKPENATIRAFIIAAVKANVEELLANCLTDEDASLDAIIAKVQANVMQQTKIQHQPQNLRRIYYESIMNFCMHAKS